MVFPEIKSVLVYGILQDNEFFNALDVCQLLVNYLYSVKMFGLTKEKMDKNRF